MSGDWGYLVVVEGILIFGGVLAFGFWELHKLKKLREAREANERMGEVTRNEKPPAEPQTKSDS
jgi:predicted negative regulator of RcsB-dependent stress response